MKDATFPERRKAQRIAKSLKDRYGSTRAAELLGISPIYFRGIVVMSKRSGHTSHNGQQAYAVPNKTIFHVLDKAKEVILG